MTLWELAQLMRTGNDLTIKAETRQAYKNCAKQLEQWAREHKKEWLAGAKICTDQVNYCVWDLGVPEDKR